MSPVSHDDPLWDPPACHAHPLSLDTFEVVGLLHRGQGWPRATTHLAKRRGSDLKCVLKQYDLGQEEDFEEVMAVVRVRRRALQK